MTPPILDFPDPEKGRAMFEDVYGARGPQRFRLILKIMIPLTVVAAVSFLICQITGTTGIIISTVYSWLPPASKRVEAQKAPQPSSESPAPTRASSGVIESGGFPFAIR
jgi:hypothetical protein